MPYWTEFRHIDRRVRRATRALVVAKPWRLSPARQAGAFQAWLREASRVYGCPIPTLRFDPAARHTGGGWYRPGNDGEIVLDKCSVVTLLHEFRHHLQRQPGFRSHVRGIEPDARAWSLSLFHRVAPRRFRRMVLARRILHTRPDQVEAA